MGSTRLASFAVRLPLFENERTKFCEFFVEGLSELTSTGNITYTKSNCFACNQRGIL